jgi:hypothetical protein
MKQPLYNIYYQDTDPTNWSRRPSDPRVGQFVGLVIGASICGFFFIFTMCWLINYCYPCSKS